MVIGQDNHGNKGIIVSCSNACVSDFWDKGSCVRSNCKFYHNRSLGELVTCLPGTKREVSLGPAGSQTKRHNLYKDSMRSQYWDTFKAKRDSNLQRNSSGRNQRSNRDPYPSSSQSSGRSRSRDTGRNIKQEGLRMRDLSTSTDDELRELQKRIKLELASREVKRKHAIRKEESERIMRAELEAELSQIKEAQEAFPEK